jgi:site-specific recombinase XerD
VETAVVLADHPSSVVSTADDVMLNLATFLRINVSEGDASENTIRAYLTHIGQFYRWCLERGIDAGRATETDLATYRRYLVMQGYKRSTMAVKLSAVRRFFQAAIWGGLREDNPAEGLRAPRQHTTRRDHILARYLSPEEVALLLSLPALDAPAGIRDLAMMGLMYYHGLRVSEVAKLEMQSVRLEVGQLLIQKSKGSKDRVLPLVDDSTGMLRSWLTIRREMANKRSGAGLFLSLSKATHGAPITSGGVRWVVNRYLTLAGIRRPGVSCHALRHAHASHVIEAGGDLVALSQEMGHASIETTGIYTHVVDAMRQNPAAYIQKMKASL